MMRKLHLRKCDNLRILLPPTTSLPSKLTCICTGMQNRQIKVRYDAITFRSDLDYLADAQDVTEYLIPSLNPAYLKVYRHNSMF